MTVSYKQLGNIMYVLSAGLVGLGLACTVDGVEALVTSLERFFSTIYLPFAILGLATAAITLVWAKLISNQEIAAVSDKQIAWMFGRTVLLGIVYVFLTVLLILNQKDILILGYLSLIPSIKVFLEVLPPIWKMFR